MIPALTGILNSVSGVTSRNFIFCIDPDNTYSYPGTGTTCTNIAGLGGLANNTLQNGTALSTTDGWKSFSFDGVDDHIDIFLPNVANVCTIELWARITSFNTKMLFSWDYYSVFLSGGMGFNTGNSDLYGISSATVSSLGLLNNWKQYVFIMYSESYLNNSIYVNGQYQPFETSGAGMGAPSFVNFSTERGTANSQGWGSANIGCWKHSSATTGALFTPMRLGLVRIYNAALTGTEILQNFNASKARFGIA